MNNANELLKATMTKAESASSRSRCYHSVHEHFVNNEMADSDDLCKAFSGIMSRSSTMAALKLLRDDGVIQVDDVATRERRSMRRRTGRVMPVFRLAPPGSHQGVERFTTVKLASNKTHQSWVASALSCRLSLEVAWGNFRPSEDAPFIGEVVQQPSESAQAAAKSQYPLF